MITNQDIRAFHCTAVLASVDIVDKVRPEDLDRATPCDGWNLGQLLAHMTVQHRGFAAAARGDGADPAQWDAATMADAVAADPARSEEHTSELQSRLHLVCRLLLEKKKTKQ